MKLRELDAWFWRIDPSGHVYHQQETADGAHGLFMLCPCLRGHALVVWFSNPINTTPAGPEHEPRPRWTREGTTLDDLTVSPSINVDAHGTKCWHGWIRNGEVTNA